MKITDLQDFFSYEELVEFSGVKISVRRDEHGSVRALRINDIVMIATEELSALVDMARWNKNIIKGMESVMRDAQEIDKVADHYYK